METLTITQGEPHPNIAERRDQRFDVVVAVQWGRGQPQALGAARHRRVIDRLPGSSRARVDNAASLAT